MHWFVIFLLLIALLGWLFLRFYLRPPDLSAYDSPPQDTDASQTPPSPGYREALRRLQQANQEIAQAPRKRRLEVIRRVMARGFADPTLLGPDSAYQVRPVEADGVSGEWVLAPDSDPDRRLLYLHGGGFYSGCARGQRVITTQMARVSKAAVLALDYRLLPEHSRRGMIQDCRNAYGWLLDHGPAGPAPARTLFVAGDSAGGNLALMLLAWARDKGLRPVDAAVLLSPGLDMALSSPTLGRNRATDPMLQAALGPFLKLPRPVLLAFMAYLNKARPHDPAVSPLYGDLSGLPPVLVQASETEMLLGDAQRYVNKARAAGSPVELHTWPGMLHVWHLFEPILPQARDAFDDIQTFLQRHDAEGAKTKAIPQPEPSEVNHERAAPL